jgi:hypothetical protein
VIVVRRGPPHDPVTDPLLVRVLDLAREECLRRGDLATCTHHVVIDLLGLTPTDRLASAGLDRVAAERLLEAELATDRNPNAVLMGGKVGTWTPRVWRVMRGAAAAAQGDRPTAIGDIWAAVSDDPASDAVRVLSAGAETWRQLAAP